MGNRIEEGRAIRARAQGAKHEALRARSAEWDPTTPDIIDDFVFGTIWNRPGLEFEERMLIAIGMLAAQGKTTQLINYLFGAIQDGMDVDKIHEAVVMSFVYGGFPNASSAMQTWTDVRERARRQGYLAEDA